MSNSLTNLVIIKVGDEFDTTFGFHHIHQIWFSPNLVTNLSLNLVLTNSTKKFMAKLVIKSLPILVKDLLRTKLGDEFVTKFGYHQVCHQIWWQFCHSFLCLIWWQYWWSPNLVTNFSPNLVTLLVITKFSDFLSSNFTKNVDHLNLSYICIWSAQ